MVWYRNPLFILLMIIGVVVLIIVVANMGVPSVSSKEGLTPAMNAIVGFWWLFLSLGFLLLLIALLFTWRKIARLGLLLIFLGIFLIEVVYVLPIFGGYLDIFKGDLTLVDCSKITPSEYLQYISCLFGGHAIEAKNLWIGWIIWFVFVFILPLAILYSLFYEFSDFFANKNVRNVITFAMSLIAYRALMSTIFIEILTYGAGGIGLLLINWLFFGYIVKVVDRIFGLAEKSERLANILFAATEKRRFFYKALSRSGYWSKLERAINNNDLNTFHAIAQDIISRAGLVLTLEDKNQLQSRLGDIENLLSTGNQQQALQMLNNLKNWLNS